MLKLKSLTVAEQMRNAMRAAQWRGVDPRNAHDAQEREWLAVARVRHGVEQARRARASVER